MELHELKQHWLKLQQSYARKLELIHELESIENQIEDLGMKDRKRFLDHELDRIEHIDESDLIKAREYLAAHLRTAKPELFAQYEVYVKRMDSNANQVIQIQEWLNFYQTILPHLEEIFRLRTGSQGFGLFKYLLGQNPTALITQEIQTIQRLSNAQKREFENPTLLHLQQLVNKRWDFAQIENEYKPLYKQLKEQYRVLSETQKKAAESKLAAEKNLYEWLENLG